LELGDRHKVQSLGNKPDRHGSNVMLKSTKGYRGIEYAIRSRGQNKWGWAIYPKKTTGRPANRGQATGARDNAITAAEKAIDALLRENSN
jgi:hypothetical protein